METVEKRPLTTRDKVAGLVALCLMAGFVLDPIQYVVATALSLLVHPLTAVFPFSALLSGVGSATGLLSAVLTVRLVDDDRVDRLKDRAETLQERLKSEESGEQDAEDGDRTEDLGPELATTQLELLKAQFRPAIYSALVTVPAFLWLRWVFAAPATALAPAVVVLPAVGPVAWSATLVGPLKVWLVWYFGASVSTRLIARRAIRRLDRV